MSKMTEVAEALIEAYKDEEWFKKIKELDKTIILDLLHESSITSSQINKYEKEHISEIGTRYFKWYYNDYGHTDMTMIEEVEPYQEVVTKYRRKKK